MFLSTTKSENSLSHDNLVNTILIVIKREREREREIEREWERERDGERKAT